MFPCKQLYSGLKSTHTFGKCITRSSQGAGAWPACQPRVWGSHSCPSVCTWRRSDPWTAACSKGWLSIPLLLCAPLFHPSYAAESKQSVCAEVLADVKIQIFHPGLKAWKERERCWSTERSRSHGASQEDCWGISRFLFV